LSRKTLVQRAERRNKINTNYIATKINM
jgi:hypothetical protein